MLGKVLKEEEEKITKVGTDLKKILPIMVAAGCVTQWYSGSLEASFKDRQAGRWGEQAHFPELITGTASALPAMRSE